MKAGNLFSFSNPSTESKRKVIVLGDVMLDQYWYGNTSRISPEAPVPVVHVADEESRPGGAANVALNLKCLGAEVVLIGIVGEDNNAKKLKHHMSQAGIECEFISANNISTITKLRIMAQNQQLIRTDFEHPQMRSEGVLSEILELLEKHLDSADALVLSDYGKGCLRPSAPFIETARKHNLPIVVDPKGTDWTLYKGATLITPNNREFEQVVGTVSNNQQLVEKASDLINSLELSALLITRGAEGMSLVHSSGQDLHIPTQAQEVFDVTGAGDTVLAALALCLAHEVPLADAVPIANTAAGLVVAKLGTATVSREELSQALAEHTPLPPSGIVSESTLIAIRQTLKAKQKTVVMTNGCFDLLHPGHIEYLQAARALGDCLIVAVNEDATIKKLKGEQRPINRLQDRMIHLAALGCVDWVVPFSEETPERLIQQVLPDLLVKGGDYQIHEIAGATAVSENGGQVKVLPFKPGYSTTKLIEKILATEPTQLA